MVVSVNPIPESELFLDLLGRTVNTLSVNSRKNVHEYLDLLGSKLENVVADVMQDHAINTPFEGSIELISGQKFPDIIANRFYGVEVKTSKQNHWTTTGNSVLESTRVEGIERVYMLFGKMVDPIEFKFRSYEECLSEVVVTHSPRYLIDMNLPEGNTIFDKISIPYDEFRTLPNPIKPIIEFYRQFLRKGEEVWWMDYEEPKSTSLIIRLWNNLPIRERNEYMMKSMILYPEIFSNRNDKYNSLSVWLVNSEGIVCPNIRDVFTAGGKDVIIWNEKYYFEIPRIIKTMSDSLHYIKTIINEIDIELLELNWGKKVSDRVNDWINLICYYNTSNLPFNLKEYLKDQLIYTQD